MKPWLWLPPQLAHDLGPYALRTLARFKNEPTPVWRPFEFRSLHFQNRWGIAGGVDKNGDQVLPWWALGAGFVEIGTITPQPQTPNPGKIMDRDLQLEAVWNKMGFPSKGIESVKKNLAKLKRPYRTPIFLNVGKNRNTANESASADYLKGILELDTFADAFVINISSPNTSGLRDLQGEQYLRDFLMPILQARRQLQDKTKPILLKLSPDLSVLEQQMALDVSCELGIDGWILTNTTTSRPPQSFFAKEGGLSGKPLGELSKQNLRAAIRHLGSRRDGKLIVSAGGIFTSADVTERISMGADLVQMYAALIFEGPFYFRNLSRQLQSSP